MKRFLSLMTLMFITMPAFRIKDGGHTWTYWRMELTLVMEFVSKSFTQY